MTAVSPGASTQAAGTFAPGTVVALLLVGLVAFVGLGVLATYGPELQGGAGGGANALSRSAVGYAGIVRLLRQTGQPVTIGRGRGGLKPTNGLLVLTPPPEAKAADITRLTAGERRAILIVAPKWVTVMDPRHPGWVMEGALSNISTTQALLKVAGDGIRLDGLSGTTAVSLQGGDVFANLGLLSTGPIRSLRVVTAPGGMPLLTDDGGHVILARTAGGMYLLSDPDLLDNLGLADSHTAAAAASILEVLGGGNGPIDFDVSLDGLGRPRSLLGLALTPPFLGATLCLLAAAILMGAHAAVRFGPVRAEGRAIPLGKAALLDNTAVLIGLAKREPAMGRRYVALVRRALSRRVGAPGGEAVSDAALDRLAPRADPPFAALAGEAERAHDAASLMRAVRALHQRQVEILGERS